MGNLALKIKFSTQQCNLDLFQMVLFSMLTANYMKNELNEWKWSNHPILSENNENVGIEKNLNNSSDYSFANSFIIQQGTKILY
jgi:hypothetical protein